ncbi:MAG: AMP-binding protein [Oscillospiraceae bacterium]|jgi:D-alanine--poly(phosphoribitol) ligase subunit 1
MNIDIKLKSGKDKAYICLDDSITYDELKKGVSALADYLKTGVNMPVMIYGHKSSLMYISILACISAKRTYIPCDVSMPDFRISQILKKSGANKILSVENTNMHKAECIDKFELEKIISEYSGPILENISIDSEDDAYIIFTSGSTGEPKGVRISYSNIANFLKWFISIPAVSEIKPKAVLNQAVFSFDLSVADIYYSVLSGAKLFALKNNVINDFKFLFFELKESKAEMAVLTPSFAQLCLCDKSFNSDLMPELRLIFFCGEVLKPIIAKKLFERFKDIRILNAYGPTEATCAVCAVEITQDMLNYSSLPVGNFCCCATEISMVDEDGEILPESETGQILLSGKSVGNGYLKAESTQFFNNKNEKSYYTGDMGYIKNNMLFYSSRKDEMIKYKGYRIEPGDVENNLCRIQGVKQAAVIISKRADGRLDSFSAYISCDNNISIDMIKKLAGEYLPEYMIPKLIFLRNELPVNQNGKIDKNKLRGEIQNAR